MGAHTPIPFGEAEAKAFNVFMKKYIKLHQDQNEDECNLNCTNAWGKLTPEQKMFFAVRPRACTYKKRGPVMRKRGKQKRVVGRAGARLHGKKKLTKARQCKYRKYRKPVRNTRRCD